MPNTTPARGEKSILLVSYHFPPDSQVGGKRIARVSKYLRNKGWRVGVLTVQDRYYERRDDSIAIEGIDVFRTAMFVNIRFLYLRMKRWFSGRRSWHADRPLQSASIIGGGEDPLMESGRSAKEGFIAKTRRNVLSIIKLPDDYLGWMPFALVRLLSLIRKYDVIYASAPPRSTLLAPLFVSMFFKKLRWISEFRDPWTSLPKSALYRSRIADGFERRWEAEVFRKSAIVIVVTEAMERDFANKYPEYAWKLRTFYNGFDLDEFSHIEEISGRKNTEKLTIAYAGQFDYGRNPRIFLEAVASLIDEKKLRRDGVDIRLMGDRHFGGVAIRDIAAQLGLEGVVRDMGYVPFKNCLEQMSESDILLLFNIRQPLQVPAKFYEYLALRKAILLISTGGITDRLLERTGAGIVVRPNDMSGIKSAIMRLAAPSSIMRNEAEIRKFDITSIFTNLEGELLRLRGSS